jgi:signal transduction histidine kinase
MINCLTCLSCSSKFCEKSTIGTFDICQYGVSYVNNNGNIITKEPTVPLSTIAKNLRHELNPILQTIIQQVSIIDPSLSTKHIDGKNPLSLIIGSTIVIDNFIQMITGVHEFHSLPDNEYSKKIRLKDTIDLYHVTYGIVKEDGRTKNLQLNNLIPDNYYIEDCADFIQYIFAVLIDNAWKYSIDNSTLTVNLNQINNNNYTIKITNQSKTIPENIDIFELGKKANPNTKGFGYGLNWVKTLEASYNNVFLDFGKNAFQVTHNQIKNEMLDNISYQEFILNNIKIIKK